MVILGRCYVGVGLIDALLQQAHSLGYESSLFAKPYVIDINFGSLVLSKELGLSYIRYPLRNAVDKLTSQGVFEKIVDSYTANL